MSSRYTTTNLTKNGFNTLCISLMNVLGSLINPNGITSHSYNSSFVLKIVFHSLPSLIWIWWYPLYKSILVKYVDPLKQSIKLSILSNGNLYLIMILLISLESVHILHSPPFLGVSTTSTTHGLKLSLINPLSNNS